MSMAFLSFSLFIPSSWIGDVGKCRMDQLYRFPLHKNFNVFLKMGHRYMRENCTLVSLMLWCMASSERTRQYDKNGCLCTLLVDHHDNFLWMKLTYWFSLCCPSNAVVTSLTAICDSLTKPFLWFVIGSVVIYVNSTVLLSLLCLCELYLLNSMLAGAHASCTKEFNILCWHKLFWCSLILFFIPCKLHKESFTSHCPDFYISAITLAQCPSLRTPQNAQYLHQFLWGTYRLVGPFRSMAS